MKYLVGLVMMIVGSFVYAADDVPTYVEDVVRDRLQGEWSIVCSGSRTDGKKPGQDWSIANSQMDYLGYGILSHTLIDFLNSTYLEAGNAAFEQMGVDTRLRIIE